MSYDKDFDQLIARFKLFKLKKLINFKKINTSH